MEWFIGYYRLFSILYLMWKLLYRLTGKSSGSAGYFCRMLSLESTQIIHDAILISLLLLWSCGDVEKNHGPQDQNVLDFVHLNVNGLRDKLDIIMSQLASYDVICITESHLNSSVQSDGLKIPGFHIPIRRDREANSWAVCVSISNVALLTQGD